jgi:hypothetical protein
MPAIFSISLVSLLFLLKVGKKLQPLVRNNFAAFCSLSKGFAVKLDAQLRRLPDGDLESSQQNKAPTVYSFHPASLVFMISIFRKWAEIGPGEENPVRRSFLAPIATLVRN